MNAQNKIIVWAFLALSPFYSLFATDLLPTLISCGKGAKPVYPATRFYGFKNADEGPNAETAFQDVKALADREHAPLVLIWGNEGCDKCETFIKDCNDPNDKQGGIWLCNWLKTANCVFAFFKGRGGTQHPMSAHTPIACKEAYDFCYENGARPPWPLYVCYWSYKDPSKKPDIVAGSLGNTPSVPGLKAIVNNFVNTYKKSHTDTPTPPEPPEEEIVPGAAMLLSGNTEGARLEAMESTESVLVPMAKTNALDTVTTNLLVAIRPDKTAVTNEIEWLAGEDVKEFPLTVDCWTNTAKAAISLELRDGKGVLNGRSQVAFVADRANAPLFPKWIGEDFELGEWTLDWDAATNKVAEANRNGTNAFTLAVVGGGLWCPDCINCDKYLTGTADFTDWAKSNNIALVVSDQPKFGTTQASLVTHDFAAGGNSGSYYLSLKGVTIDEGMAQFVAMTNRSYNLWKVDDSAARVANPTFILFRPNGAISGVVMNGEIAGRLQESRIRDSKVQQNNEAYDLAENLARLDELLLLANDTSDHGLTEEANDRIATTPLTHAYVADAAAAIQTPSRATLQINDTVDYFKLENLPEDTYVDFLFTFDGEREKAENAGFAADILVWNGSAYAVLPPIKENTWKFSEADLAHDVYLRLSAYGDARYLTFGRETTLGVSFCSYAMLPDPGKVGFVETTRVVREGSVESVAIPVERTRWHTGPVKAYLTLDTEATTAQAYRHLWPTNAAGEYVKVELDWAGEELGGKSFDLPILDDPVWDGDEQIVLLLSGDDSGVEVDSARARYVLTIKEDDTKEPGKIGFSPEACEPAAAKTALVFAKENTAIRLAVERRNGSNGEASVRLSSTGGTLIDDRLTWDNKDVEAVKYALLTLPSLAAGQTQSTLYVTLKKDGDVPVESTASRIQIRVLPENAMEFESPVLERSGVQTEAFSTNVVLATQLPEGAVVTVSKSSGSVPAGVSVTFDKAQKRLVVSGMPTGYGNYSAVYQLVVRVNGKATYSMPITVNLNLVSRAQYNPFLATAHAFTDLPVVDTNGTGRLIGLLDVTLPVNGRHTAKYRRADGRTVPMTATGWQWITASDGTVAFTSRTGHEALFIVDSRGGVSCALHDPELVGTGDNGWFHVWRPSVEPWSASNMATNYQGVYTVEVAPTNKFGTVLCTGATGLSLKLNTTSAYRSGKMTFAGTLPNGKAVNGSAAIMAAEDGPYAILPVFVGSTSDTFASLMTVTGGLAVTGLATGNLKAVRCHPAFATVWNHAEPRLPDDFGYETVCSIWGAYLPIGKDALDWSARWTRDFGVTELPFKIDGDDKVTMLVANGKTVKVKSAQENPLGLTISYNATTGIARGTVKVDGRVCSWAGVFLPDWHECGSCGSAVETEPRPFLYGSCWSNYLEDYEKGGRTLKASVREGLGVRIDKAQN